MFMPPNPTGTLAKAAAEIKLGKFRIYGLLKNISLSKEESYYEQKKQEKNTKCG